MYKYYGSYTELHKKIANIEKYQVKRQTHCFNLGYVLQITIFSIL